MNKKLNDMERMIRELKESHKGMIKMISEQFAYLAMFNTEKWVSPSKLEVNPRGSSFSFDPNDVQKANAIIYL